MIPAPLYRDPMVIRREADGLYFMFYTQCRANQPVGGGGDLGALYLPRPAMLGA